MYGESEIPELDEVLQEEPADTLLDVQVHGAVQVHHLPSRIGVSRQFTCGTTDPVPLLGEDSRRRVAILVSVGQNMIVGEKDRVKDGTAALWPANVPLPITHQQQVYALSATSTTVVSVISENWAD